MHKCRNMCTCRGSCAQVLENAHAGEHVHKSEGMCASWGHVHKSGGMCTSLEHVHKSGGMCIRRGTCTCAQVGGACAQVRGNVHKSEACAQVGGGVHVHKSEGHVHNSGGHVHKSRGMCTSRGHVYRSGACAQVGGMCTTRGTCAEVNKMGPTLIERIHVCLFQWEVHKLQYKSSIPVLIT